MSEGYDARPTNRRTSRPRRSQGIEVHRHRTQNQRNPVGLSDGDAAAQRASAGMGLEDTEPTDWLFGDALGKLA
jgi:hypothetical protein